MPMIDRFGLSALSRVYKEYALPEEIMLHKETGEYLIKTKSGDVISFDMLSRLNEHINHTTMMSLNLGISGDLYQIEFDDIELPEIITENVNLLSSPMTIVESGLKKLYLSVDCDAIVRSDTDKIDVNEPVITLDFKFTCDSDIKTYTLIIPSQFLRGRLIQPYDFLPLDVIADNYKVQLTNISIVRDAGSSTSDMKFILYSVLAHIEQ